MAKADRIVSYFPSFYKPRRRTTLLYEVIQALARPLEDCDTLLFRIQRAHRLRVAEHAQDILRLAAALNLTSFHFEDILNNTNLTYEDKLARLRDRVLRIAQIHLAGLGTPRAVLESAAVFLDATLISTRVGESPLQTLDADGYSHVAQIEFSHIDDKPRERLYLHENPLVRRKEEPTGRWATASWTIGNHSADPSPITISIQGVGDRTVLPTLFCPDLGEGVVFDDVVPDGQILVADNQSGIRLGDARVDASWIHYRGGIFDYTNIASGTASMATAVAAALPATPPGVSHWYLDVARGVYDAATFDRCVFDLPTEPVGVADGDFAFDSSVFDYPPSAIAGMAWDERMACAFKLLLPAAIPQPKDSSGTAPNYVGRVGSILPRFKSAGMRAFVDTAHDTWILGEAILRFGSASDGDGTTTHVARLRDARSDLYVDPGETAQ